MKLLFVTNGLHQKTGTYTVLKNICPRLLENHEVTILTNQGDVDIECTKLIQLDAQFFPFPQYFYQSKLKNLVKSGIMNDYCGPPLTIDMSLGTKYWKKYDIEN